MDFGSLDFATWRLVGLGLLALGAIAAVVAIVAIILTFRGGRTDDYRGAVETQRHDDDDDDDADDDLDDDDLDDDDLDDDDDPHPRDARRDRDGGPTALPMGPGSRPQESLFTVAADTPPRPPLRSTRDEPHVPSPDWYDYADVDATPAVDDRDDDPRTAAVAATREAERPATPPPAVPSPSPAEEQSDLSDRGDARRASRWFDETASAKSPEDVSPSFLARYSDTKSAPAAGAPVIFPWERRAETTNAEPERPVAPAPQEPRRPTAERHAERTDTGGTAEASPAAVPQRPDVPTPAAALAPTERQEQQRPAAQRHAERDDTGTTAAVPTVTPAPSDARPAKPTAAAREESDAPDADWYDDPDGSGGERWWDGKSWTRHRRPRSGAPVTTDTGRQRAVARSQEAPSAAAGRRRTSAETESGEPAGGAAASRPPGWYRDPSGAGGRRFWDGSRWTNDT